MDSEKRNHYTDISLKTRSESNNDLYIEGYFVIFDEETKIYKNKFEKISRGAFKETIKNGDIRCLFNHHDGMVLGRTKSGTLELCEDSKGLFGKVKINREDTQAMDIYQRVKRGDITGCSFGFYPTKQDLEIHESSSGNEEYHFTILEADMDEVSICTFPAYKGTEIQARSRDIERLKSENIKHKKEVLNERLKKLCSNN